MQVKYNLYLYTNNIINKYVFLLDKIPKIVHNELTQNSSLDGVVPHLCYESQILTSLAFLLSGFQGILC
jgi:hypothetical protein